MIENQSNGINEEIEGTIKDDFRKMIEDVCSQGSNLSICCSSGGIVFKFLDQIEEVNYYKGSETKEEESMMAVSFSNSSSVMEIFLDDVDLAYDETMHSYEVKTDTEMYTVVSDLKDDDDL